MLFNSLEFAIFLPLVFAFYWFAFAKSVKAQNILLLLTSYFFYGWWDYRFLFLLLFSTSLDYYTGLKIHQAETQSARIRWLLLSVGANLGFLGFFKYYNFFVESFANLLSAFGLHANMWTLSIILPVGISFYTFHGLSYVFDIYNRKIEPTKELVEYSCFVCFFPLLVAGPIERATHLLPQFFKARVFSYDYATTGPRLILWGLFKKMVIADNCSKIVNEVFGSYQTSSGLELILGTVFFSFQIYCDFSGYSDIARGSARLFGFDVYMNFRTPYFARDIAEFWKRWHISLTSWFRDYVYIPLGGSRLGKLASIKNTIIIFILSGFWHGANWTFIAWGALNAIYFMPLLALDKTKVHTDTVAMGRFLPSAKEVIQMTVTFALVCIAWVFFRSENLNASFSYLSSMGTNPFFGFSLVNWRSYFPIILVYLVLIDWMSRESDVNSFRGRWIPLLFDLTNILMIVLFGAFNKNTFIYFQF